MVSPRPNGRINHTTESASIPQRWRVDANPEPVVTNSLVAWTTTHAATEVDDLETELEMILEELPDEMSPELVAKLKAQYPAVPAADDPATNEAL